MLTLVGCSADDANERLRINNKSGEDIFCHIRTYSEDIKCSDTLLPLVKRGEVLKNEKWTDVYFAPEFSCDSMRVFIISLDTLEKYPWTQVREENNILKRYDISARNLHEINWEITIPPLK